jgi:hypothetical protein
VNTPYMHATNHEPNVEVWTTDYSFIGYSGHTVQLCWLSGGELGNLSVGLRTTIDKADSTTNMGF